MLNKAVSQKQDQQLSQIYRDYKIANDDRFTYYNLYRTMEVYIKQYTNCCQELDGNPRVKNNHTTQLQRACRSLVQHINQIGQEIKMTGLAQLSLTYLHIGQMIQDFTRKFLRLNQKIIHRFYENRFSLIYGESNKASVRNSRRCSQTVKINEKSFDYVKEVEKNMYKQLKSRETENILNQTQEKQQSVKTSKECSQEQDDYHRLSSFSRVIMAKDVKEISQRSQTLNHQTNLIYTKRKRRYTIARVIEDDDLQSSNSRRQQANAKRNKSWVQKDTKIMEDTESQKQKSQPSIQDKQLKEIKQLQKLLKEKQQQITAINLKFLEFEKKVAVQIKQYQNELKYKQEQINKLNLQIANANQSINLMELIYRTNMTLPQEQISSFSPTKFIHKNVQKLQKSNIKEINKDQLISNSKSLEEMQAKIKQSKILSKVPTNKENIQGYILPKCLKKKYSDPLSKSLSSRFNYIKPVFKLPDQKTEQQYNFSYAQKNVCEKIHKKRFFNTQTNKDDVEVPTRQLSKYMNSLSKTSTKNINQKRESLKTGTKNIKQKKESIKNLFAFFALE